MPAFELTLLLLISIAVAGHSPIVGVALTAVMAQQGYSWFALAAFVFAFLGFVKEFAMDLE